MKKILSIVFLLFSVFCKSQTTALSFTPIANDYLRGGGGANNWNDGYVIPVPPGGSTGVSAGIDRYMRLAWSQIENDDSSFNWSAFDIRAQLAINAGQKLSIAWMGYGEGVAANSSPSGVPCTYPGTLHAQMQAETNKDYNGGDTWVPNINSPSYLRRYKRLMAAIANHIATTTYNGVPYSKIIYMVDVRVFGSFGECHNYPYTNSDGRAPNGQAMPSYLNPGQSACDSIISWYIKYFPNNPLTILHLFYNNGGDSNVPLESIYNALTARNNWGPIGWRRDSWGDATNYLYIIDNNAYSYNPGSGNFVFKTAIMSRYQTAPVNGEPLNGLASYNDVDVEVKKYGVSSFGNGNIANPTTPSVISAIQLASFDAGCRLQLKSSGGTITTTIPVNSTIQLTLPWSNIGSAPSYETWIANLIIKNSGGTVVKTQASNFKPKLFLPGSANFIDNISTTGLVAGNYTLYVKIVDSIGYRRPMMISNSGLQADTSYQITPFTISAGGGGGGTPPTVSAGSDITITSPASSASPTATVTFHSPATAATPHWTQISGPNTATISNANVLNPTMSGLTQGNYVFQVTGTDNTTPTPLTASDQMQIIVNAAPLAPNAAAANLTTLVNTTVNPSVSGSPKPPATLVLFNYTWVSGPATPSIANPFTSTPQVSGLTAPGQYIFDWAVTDNNATPLTTHKRDTITVNAAPSGCNCIAGTGALDQLNVSLEAAFCWGQKPLIVKACARMTDFLPMEDTLLKIPMAKADDSIYQTKLKVDDGMSILVHADGSMTISVDSLPDWTRTIDLTKGITVATPSPLTSRGDIVMDGDSKFYHVDASKYYYLPDSLPHCLKPTIALTSNYTVPIVPPINTVAFAYSGKSNNKGNGKMTYSFIQVSGPTATVVSTVVSRATVSALQAGTSVFALTGKDDCGAALTVYYTVVVKPAVIVTKYLVKVVHVPSENQYDLYYSDGSVTYINILKTFLWGIELPNPANPKGIIFQITLNDAKHTTTPYQ